jgi:hypothetical protein
MREFKPRSLAEYLDVIETLQKGAQGALWYRGCSSIKHRLLPTLYRDRPRASGADDISELESALVTRFRERSIPYQSRPLGSDDLETLFLMQHFGVPTRLLDWTENPFAALFFAVRSAPYRYGKSQNVIFQRDAVVWLLDPVKWNRGVLSRSSFKGGVLNPSHDFLKAYRGIGQVNELAPRPIALYGAHNSPRIVAQQGVFVLFGRGQQPMDQITQHADVPSGCLMRLVVTRGVIGKMRDSLFQHGITDAALFPDLEGLARDLCRTYGFAI